eukprot:517557_1
MALVKPSHASLSYESDDEDFPDDFTIVTHKRGQQAVSLAASSGDDMAPMIKSAIIKFQNISKENKIKGNDLDKIVSVIVHDMSNDEEKTKYESQLSAISKKADDRSIVKCIGRVFIQRKATTSQLHSGTGTVFKKWENGYIAVLTCAHNILDDDNTEAHKIWFAPDPQNKDPKTKLKCIAWYYPRDRYECKYDTTQKHDPYDLGILICKDKHNYYDAVNVNDDIRIIDSNQKQLKCNIFGYPKKWNDNVLYGMSGGVELNNKHDEYHYKIETYPGHSGSPIFQSSEDDNQRFMIYGIHIYGDEDNQDNIGIKLDENKLKWIENHVDGIDKIMTKYANSHKEMKSQLKSWEYKSFWKCENCGFINERLMIGGLWRLYHLYDSCGLCGDKRDEDLNSKTSRTTEPREVQWHKFTDDSQPKLTRQTSAFRRAMIPIEDEDDADKTVVAEEKTDDLVNTSQYKYSIYRTGIAMRYHELEPLYANLKDSLIASKLLSKSEYFVQALNKAKEKERDCVFDVYGRACITDKRYGIQIDERMHIEHVLSFVLYCDYTLLCYKFMRSYIASNVDDSNETITQRHVETFYWLGRFIRSAIEFWGETIRKDTRLFFPVSFPLLYDQFAGTIDIPTSTTKTLEVAVNISRGVEGVIMTVAPKFKRTIQISKYLDMTYISRYKEEDQRLIAGTARLAIIDIRGFMTGKEVGYGIFVRAILYFEKITEQTESQRLHYNYGTLSKKRQERDLLPLIEYQQNKRSVLLETVPQEDMQYICDVFKHWCGKRTKVNLSCINEEFVNMADALRVILFKRVNAKEFQVDIMNIKKTIFPNLQLYKLPNKNVCV